MKRLMAACSAVIAREHEIGVKWKVNTARTRSGDLANTSNRVAWTVASCRILGSGCEGQLWFQWLDPISAIRARRPGRRSIARWSAVPNREKRETAAMVRIDSTITAALMNEQSDSALLWVPCG